MMPRYGLVVNKEDMSFEELEIKVKKDLEDAGIDISKDDYYKNPSFAKFKKSFVSEGGVAITEAWWIEQNFVGQKRLEKIYGPYAMGIERKLTEEELQEKYLFKVLADKYPEKSRTENYIWKYFYRDEGDENDSKKGLFKRLEKIGFFMDRFPNSQEKLRLMYFLYCFEVDNNVKIGAFLDKPTLENVDDGFIGIETKNGDLMAELKRGIGKSLSVDYRRMVLNGIVHFTMQWEEQIKKIIAYLDFTITDEYADTLKRICYQLEEIVSMMLPLQEGNYTDALLETFYLKLFEHEHMGREYDVLDVNLRNTLSEEAVSYKPEAYKLFAYRPIKKSEMESFLRDKKEELLPFVFERDIIEQYDRERYDRVLSNVSNFLNIVEENTKAAESEVVPMLYAIVYMQEFINIDKKERIPNDYYRYKTGEIKSINQELNLGNEARRKSQIAIARRVTRRMYKYAGKAELSEVAFKAEMYIDMIISRIHQCDSFKDMCYMNNFFLNLTDTVFLSDKQLDEAEQKLKKAIGRKKKGYSILYQDMIREKRRYFLGTIYNSPIIDDLGKKIGKKLLEADVRNISKPLIEYIELTHNYMGAADNYVLKLFIYSYEKVLMIEDFFIVMEGELHRVLKRNAVITE